MVIAKIAFIVELCLFRPKACATVVTVGKRGTRACCTRSTKLHLCKSDISLSQDCTAAASLYNAREKNAAA